MIFESDVAFFRAARRLWQRRRMARQLVVAEQLEEPGRGKVVPGASLGAQPGGPWGPKGAQMTDKDGDFVSVTDIHSTFPHILATLST